MLTFAIKRHIEIDESYQGFNLTEFAFRSNEELNSDSIVDSFIHSFHFSYESLRDCQKQEPNRNYLRQAFDISKIIVSDFKKLDKESTAKFLLDFVDDSEWADDKYDFYKIREEYLAIHNTLENGDFYIISKDWFEKDDERVLEPESWVYTYYFLIIYINQTAGTLIVSEWTYD